MQRAAPADQMTVEQVNITFFFTAEVTEVRRGYGGRASRPILEFLRDLRARYRITLARDVTCVFLTLRKKDAKISSVDSFALSYRLSALGGLV